jgi:hypothetical protein
MRFWNVDTIYWGNKIWLDTLDYSPTHHRNGELQKKLIPYMGDLALKKS